MLCVVFNETFPELVDCKGSDEKKNACQFGTNKAFDLRLNDVCVNS